MIIKKLVAGSMFSMLLASEMATADWGDVYYCQITNFLRVTLEGKQINLTPEKFQFKLDQTKNAMVFGSTGYFKDRVVELVKGGRSHPILETWYANDGNSMTYFKHGIFLFTKNAGVAHVILADCDKF
jgi:hypothetical protein